MATLFANPPCFLRKITHHGVLALIYFHVRRGPVAAVGNGLLVDLKKRKQRQFAGNMKKAMTTRIAGVASLILLKDRS
jgi:hypothetical protein